MFNVNKKEWVALGMYGQHPCSRWAHTLTSNGSSRSSDGFIVFGGVNLKSYCRTKVYQFEILNKWYSGPKKLGKEGWKEVGEEKQEIHEKIEALHNNIKEKIDIIKEITSKKD